MRLKILRQRRSPHALAGAYALDAVDPAGKARFERHLASCAACLEEVRELREAAAELGRAVAVTPPPDLRERVLAGIAALPLSRAMDAEIAALLAAPDALIASGATSAGGSALVVASPAAAAVVFISTGLPVLEPASVYELWFIGPAGARPAGLAPSGPAPMPVLLPGLSLGDAIGVTVEPAGGSPAPTTSPILVLTP